MSVEKKTQSANLERVKNTKTGIRIVALLKRKGLSQTALGAKYGVSIEAVNQTIWGVRNGKRLRQAIAFELGYVSWKGLTKARVIL